ncbi:unnamed protein product [Spirodela intermedia]|uniref:Uncharacterized protein n=1 Tax=Spirodela intermedia TaxID=51605 RepID=A0A7I8JH30_SPIIN|nr:unnamed protein product [Spirodela intermedia]CAA6669241.1 unnamed protein product [Spirodela intermedia]
MRRLLGFALPRPMPPPSLLPSAPPVERESEDRVGTNMLIILGALLCVLLCGLGLSSAARWAKRRASLGGAPGVSPARGFAVMGLKKRALRRIPVAVHAQGGAPSLQPPLPRPCIDRWLSSHPSCPTCRHSLLDLPAAAADRIS